jgi:glutamyl-tRNA reductase
VTIETLLALKFAVVKKVQLISIQHQQFPLETIGKFHLEESQWGESLRKAKEISGCEEIMYITTCNRVEWIFTLDHYVCPGLAAQIITLFSSAEESMIKEVAQQCLRLSDDEAILHCLKTAGSLNSAVIGEHEILGQMRTAYDYSMRNGFAQDGLRILMKQCIKTSKQIFTETDLRRKPVSVVSIAWSAFEKMSIPSNVPIGLIGAGQMIGNFSKFLRDHQYTDIHVFNRSIARATQLSSWFEGGVSHGLNELKEIGPSIAYWVVCTGSSEPILEATHLDLSKKHFIIDLALPNNVSSEIALSENVTYFDMKDVQSITSSNMAFRETALMQCAPIVSQGMSEYKHIEQERRLELAMQRVPTTIKEIKETALGTVFQKEFESLDEHSKAVIQDILSYMEKKYISVPMKMAKEVILEQYQKN